MDAVAQHVGAAGPFLRRRDLLAAGFTDRSIRRALAHHRLFRVRHGWYARPGTSDIAVAAVRVGGRVTGISALRARGLYLPRPVKAHIVVPANASGLRNPRNRFERLTPDDGIVPLWEDLPRGQLDPRSWIVPEREALACVLREESRDIAVAACDGMIRYLGWDLTALRRVFASAPARTHPWLSLVDGRADAWGETFLRLWLADEGIRMESQPVVPGVGRLDGRISDHLYVEIDGAQHGEDWFGEQPSSFEGDHRRDAIMAARGNRVLRFTNTQLIDDWRQCLDAILTARADDLLLTQAKARVARHARRPA